MTGSVEPSSIEVVTIGSIQGSSVESSYSASVETSIVSEESGSSSIVPSIPVESEVPVSSPSGENGGAPAGPSVPIVSQDGAFPVSQVSSSLYYLAIILSSLALG
ncbi:uncharacterized protein PRCAT00001479001 [Priceomyces carsonii]|uniref:uncharacterized protein n=1 Tax=Priceomyces carsonii TaxID=28549 RepID=UPI002EDAA732|nr:unnamed protein product [Priceomyces carsonii]